MPLFSDDLFLGSGATYMGTGNQAATSVFTGTISTTTLTVQTVQSGDPLVVGQFIVGSGVTANSYITASLGQNANGLSQYTLSQSSTVSSAVVMYASGNASLGNPAPMSLGVGPMGRIYMWDSIPEAKQANNIATSQTPAAAGSLTLTAGTSVTTLVRSDGTTAYVLDVPRGLRITTATAAASTLAGVAITGTGGQISFTSQTGLVSGQYLTISGTYGGTGSITGYSNPTTYILTAVTSTTATLTTTAGAAVVTTAGTPTGLTYTLGVAPQTATISGYDYYGQAMTQTITTSSSVSTAVNTTKAFYQVTSISIGGATGTALTVGTTDVLGIPVRVIDGAYIVNSGYNNTVAFDSPTAFVKADMTNPATSSTGDVRGTLNPSSAPDGTKRLVVAIAVPAIASGPNSTRQGTLGVTQA
jgi:hypothetical protein